MNNVVGKTLVVMQLVFSILFVCFAAAVFTFMGQWRDAAQTAQQQAEDFKTQVAEANDTINSLRESNGEAQKKLRDERDTWRAQVEGLRAKVTELDNLLELSEQKLAKALADSDSATTEVKSRVVESNELNKEIRSLQVRNRELIREQQDNQDELLKVKGDLAGAVERETLHLDEIVKLTTLLRQRDIDPDEIPEGVTPGKIEKVDGFVQRTLRTPANDQELLEVTIGSDDKIYRNTVLLIYRGGDYLGTARVMRATPDTAICVVDEATRQGQIQRGDNVTTKL